MAVFLFSGSRHLGCQTQQTVTLHRCWIFNPTYATEHPRNTLLGRPFGPTHTLKQPAQRAGLRPITLSARGFAEVSGCLKKTVHIDKPRVQM